MSTVSVFLTSYNHEKFLRESIESVLNQTYKDFELIISDDFSTDKSWDIIQSYQDERIIKIRHEKNLRKQLFYDKISQMRGKFIAVHHSDDIWEPTKLEKQVKIMENHSEYVACFTHAQLIDEDGNDFEPVDGSFYKGLFEKENRNRFEWLNYFFNEGNCLCHPSILIRKEAYEENRLLSYGLAQIPDFLMWVKLCLKDEIYIIQEKLTKFRLRENEKNTSGDRFETRIRSATEYYFLLSEYKMLKNQDDFLKVFPQAEEYNINGKLHTKYALAKICLDERKPKCYQFFALELLFELLNNPEDSKIIKQLYDYTFIDFVKETGEYDIFSAVSQEQLQNVTLFFDVGDGFSEELCIKKTSYLPSNGKFSFEFNITEYLKIKDIKQKIVSLRFDPCEGLFSICKIENVNFDGLVYTATPLNSSGSFNGYDTFLIPDPIYILEGDFKGGNIVISGSLYIMDNYKVAKEIALICTEKEALQSKYGNAQQEIYNTLTNRNKLQAQYENVLTDRNKLQAQYENVLTDRNKLQAQYENILTDRNKLQAQYENILTDRNKLQFEYENVLTDRNKFQAQYEDVLTDRNKLQFEYENVLTDRNKFQAQYEDVLTDKNKFQTLFEKTLIELKKCKDELDEIHSSKWWKMITKIKSLMGRRSLK
ncbi:glycosyltransferase [Desulforamulus aeronauticus]|uniref:Glycosyl transferase family 2 n=1 Tax=Desulforamulus aeronauticus DSM 10349 TaxID=1121421 RepID=A0A1M6T541_9FIRM|nr:glycosyltransferase [Desulforamulus aeronauticus]SHK51999.1 Glycosyl transferase family 2 [Desulforamulus aeronauticus DSM 10349]